MPKLKRIQQRIQHGDATERDAAFNELQEIRDPRALPSIVKTFAMNDSSITLQLVETIAKMPADEAAAALAQLAVEAPDAYVRERAATALKSYPEHSYVPMLIGSLAAPIEMASRASMDAGQPIYEWYEGAEYTGRIVPGMMNKIRLRSKYVRSDVMFWTLEGRRIAGWVNTGQTPDRLRYDFQLSRDSPDPDAPYEYSGAIDGLNHTGTRNRGARNFQKSVADLKEDVTEVNERTAELNQRIHAALTKATGAKVAPGKPDADAENVDVKPKWWWDWWREQSQPNDYLGDGTEVWTRLGPQPIEQILPGDRVLSRDPKSDELFFTLVVAVDAQGESAVQVIESDSRAIVAAPEQLFQVTDGGWRKASDLKAGMQLDGLAGPRPIEKVSPGETISRYSLILAHAPDFFVDRLGVRAHDATGR